MTATPTPSPSTQSPLSRFRARPPAEQRALLAPLTDTDRALLAYDWPLHARPAQRPPPGAWFVWLVKAGRGFGKTRAGAEWVRARVEAGTASRIALVNDTAADVRAVMIEGPSGLLSVCPPWDRPKYEPSKREVTWQNGAKAFAFAAEAPELLRGPQFDAAWCDEPAKWRNLRRTDPQGGTAWDNLLMGLRTGPSPQCVVTTTPRPIPWLQKLQKAATTAITGGSSYENRENLSPQWYSEVIAPYEGTRLGRQELYAEDLLDVPGALWTLAQLDATRVVEAPALVRVVVAVDPEASSDEGAAETGIIVAGLGGDGHGYILADRSLRGTPEQWARAAVGAFDAYAADRLVAEVNNGGEMVGYTLRTIAPALPYRALHASRGKYTRAEPIAALYEQGRVHHVGTFGALEDQLTQWVPGLASPDRLDACVWALTDLMLDGRSGLGEPMLTVLGAKPAPAETPEALAAQLSEAGAAFRALVQRDGMYWPGGGGR